MIFYLILFTAFLFYIFIPLSGAFVVRTQWRTFRRNLRLSIESPPFQGCSIGQEGFLGVFRFTGELEALEGDDLIWVRNSRNTVTVEMRHGSVYVMPPGSGAEKLYPHLLPSPLPMTSLKKIPWNDVFSLSEGTDLYICGALYHHEGRYVFRSEPENPLMVLIYNEAPEALIPRAVWCGRQSNEFWNFLTPWSVFSGLILLLLLSVYLIQNSPNYLLQFFCIAMALLPAVLFFPPGVFLFNLYKLFWDKARRYRAERDLMRLPLCPDRTEVPDVEMPSNIEYTRQPSGWTAGKSRKPVDVFVEIASGMADPSGDKSRMYSVRFPDHPEILARYCQKKAFLFEGLSGIVLIAGILINYLVVWVFLGWII